MPIKTSVHYSVLLLLLHLMSTIAVLLTDMPVLARLVLLLIILTSLVYYQIRDIFRLLPYSWCVIAFEHDGIAVVARDGSKLIGRVMHNSVICSSLILLRIKIEGRHFPVSRVIFSDALEADAYREFCIRLKYD